jgi:aminocarboxymuconate-semialdehyde decarboxylase
MIIDCHAHFVPSELLDAVKERISEFPSVNLTDTGGFQFPNAKPTRPVAGFLSDKEARLAWMDEQKIDRQIFGGWVDMFGNQMPAEEGVRWSTMINEYNMAFAKSNPRFIPLATLPIQDGGAAAEVIREAHAAGYRGAMIGTQPHGNSGVLDDTNLDLFWKTADDLGWAILIHPVFDSGDDRVHDYGMANAVGRITDQLIAMSRLIYAGHVTRYSNAKIIAGTGGAALPYVVGRMARNHQLDPSLGDPREALKLLYYDSIVHDPATLRFMADTVGADRIMMGSDKPFPIGDFVPMETIQAAGFSSSEQSWINGGLATQLFNL